jgi:sensor histidine kinase regulating citrate/malate metabolism
LAGQYLALQLMIVLAVLVAVLAISVAQSAQTFQRVEGRTALSAAETLAAMPAVRALVPDAEPRGGAALPALAESVRTVSGSTYTILAKADGLILTSQDPGQLGQKMDLGESQVLNGRSWTGLVDSGGGTYLVAQVPILNDAGDMVGIAAVGREYPSLGERLLQATPNLLTYLGVAGVLGVAGSLLLSRRVKRQTLGMEPDEIAGLVEHREALLYGVKEGVLALDPNQRITLVNDSARELLGLPADCIGRSLDDLGIPFELRDVLTREQSGPDQLVLVGDRVVACNRMPVRSHGRVIGSVTTLRDRTELSTLEKELGATRTTTDTLRAQTHEFANQLHTISGLIQLGEYDEVVHFVDGVSHSRTRLQDDVTARIKDPALAALFIAKASLAAERGVALSLSEDSFIERLDEEASRDLTTVMGNLVDNAMDASGGSPDPTVEVLLVEEADRLVITVQDSGPGVAEENVDDIFRQGYTTKNSASNNGRGFGLALTRLVCRKRGGDVRVYNDGGAVFTATLGKRSKSA